MSIMPWISLFLQILWEQVMPIVGVLLTLLLFLIKGGHQIPVATVRDKLGRRLIGRGSRILGKTLIAIKDEDGLWTLKPATYDGENNGYWVPTPDGREFYDASGVGGDPGGWYGGTALAVAYDGLGALAEPASGEIGRQARIKRQFYAEDLSKIDYAQYKAGETSKNLIAGAGERIHNSLAHGRSAIADGGSRVKDKVGDGVDAARDKVGDDEDGPISDGGEPVLDEWETMLPVRKTVDLRDTIYAAPFNVKPQQFHRVAENAKKGQQGFAKLGPLGQAGVIMGAFMMGAIVAYLGFTAASGGGGGISIPMGGTAGMVMPPGVLP